MLGQLPTKLTVNGVPREIRSDYRNILRIFTALNAKELKDEEKTLICLKRMYPDFVNIPRSDYTAAYKAAVSFIECNTRDSKDRPPVLNWDKDEQLIFAEVNKVAGQEIRSVPYLHWWSFLGYFQCVDQDGTWGFILGIRQKRALHKKLEKHESEFFNANRELCEVGEYVSPKDQAQDFALQLQKELLSQRDD